jgi:hypothetical protein
LDAAWTGEADDEGVESERAEHTFLVRTWREGGAAGASTEWRGSVEHLPTKERRYFREFSDLCAFIIMHWMGETPKK